MYPRQSATTHTEQLGDEASVYDWARAQVHALNPTAACVWRLCDGATSPDAMAAALRRELGIAEADAVVALTLTQLARLHLLERPVASRGDRPAPTRRWLLARGVAAVMLPVISSIVAPAPVAAQSPATGAPTLTSLSPNQGLRGTTVAVTLTGTNFAVGATTVNVVGGGVTVINVVVGSGTSLTANFVLDPAAAAGARTVTVATAAGTSGALPFTIDLLPGPGTPTLTSVSPNQGLRGTTVTVTLTGTNFAVGATGVTVSGAGVAVNTVVVNSTTSLTATFVIDAAAAASARNVTVTTAGGTSGAQPFTVNLAAPTLTNISPNQGIRGATVAITLTGTNFVVGATTVAVAGGGVTVNTVVVVNSTSLTANFVLDGAAAPGGRAVTVTTADGTSGPQTFTVGVLAPTLTSVAPNQTMKGTQATTVAVTLTGTNFVVGATTVAVSGAGVAVNNVVVGSSTSLTANFVIDPSATAGGRTVTVTTAFGTSGGQTFTINPGTTTFIFTNGPQNFTVPPLVTTLTVTALGAQGGFGSPGGLGGGVTATLTVVPGEILSVFVGGQGGLGATGGLGGFNGGGAGGAGASFHDGGGGGASDIRRAPYALADRLVVAGGGGGGTFSRFGGAGGGTTGGDGAALAAIPAAGGGTQSAGGLGGVYPVDPSRNGQPGTSGTGGQGGPDVVNGASGGGGGGGYFGGGGGAGGVLLAAGTGGGGSSFPVGATHTQGVRLGNGEVTITW